MDNRKRIENIWFYYKKHILIGLAVVLVLAYLGIQKLGTEKPDYHIGIVRAESLSAEELNALNAVFTAAGQDLNGDGQVLVQFHTYYADLADSSENAGVNNAEAVQGLDADLIGKMSGIFLLEDVETFQRLTNGVLAGDVTSMDYGLFMALRKDAPEAYTDLIANMF